ncbi:hypothetical protein ES15_0496 [Cronobacter sakazakii ES15]|nr:hypothetical protein ES15_0496 [Cronobacter sakazakii ES15]
MQDEARRAGHQRAFARRLKPRQIMNPVSEQPLHQQVPGRMKAHVVKTFAARVIAQQLWRIGVRQSP